jgi:NAD(P)-dependent dehydrogenase (short-subunit alcohol dehydrogenase family)
VSVERGVLVTGARRGIGAAIAIGLATPGTRIVLHHVAALAEIEAVARACRAAGAEVEIAEADLGDAGAVIDLAASAGRIDVLVNNAARASNVAPAVLDVAEWEATFAVNVTAAMLLARECAVGMRDRQWGRVINLTSATVRMGGPSGPAYVASKAALVGLTRALAKALGPDGITVNALSPGAVLTENERELYPDDDRSQADAEIIARQGLPRRLLADDMVGTARFLASPDSAAVTGQVIEVGGGLVLR